jgi:rSAM/selenodomain-associated transferase 2
MYLGTEDGGVSHRAQALLRIAMSGKSSLSHASRISVVMPVLNEAAQIGERLHELARFAFHEVIVVDGGSIDETRAIARRFPDVLLVEAPRGRARQMNEGARRATGDVLLFLHADVSLPADAASHIRRALAHPGTAAGAFRTWTVADEGTPRPWWSPLLHLADLRSRYSRLPYGDQALFLRREVFRDAGGFPEIPLLEDLAFSRKLRALGVIRTIPARVAVSGRRFIERPFYYTLLVNLFPLLFRLGVPASLLAVWYGDARGRARRSSASASVSTSAPGAP